MKNYEIKSVLLTKRFDHCFQYGQGLASTVNTFNYVAPKTWYVWIQYNTHGVIHCLCTSVATYS